jgi:hypothetical protein
MAFTRGLTHRHGMVPSQTDEFDDWADACLARAGEGSKPHDAELWNAIALEWLRLAAAARSLMRSGRAMAR